MTTTSKTPATTPDGRDGYRIACTCSTHPSGADAAIVGFEIGDSRIHGTVLMANHPAAMIRKGAERRRIWAA